MNDSIDDVTSIIFERSFMTLATADSDGLPWASPVEFACDEDLRFYWVSGIDVRHSQNVRANPRAAPSIYDSTQTPGASGAGTVQGLYGTEQSRSFIALTGRRCFRASRDRSLGATQVARRQGLSAQIRLAMPRHDACTD